MNTGFEKLQEAETRWFEPLYRNCAELFSGIFFPSHDHLHHARVWSHARSLLLLLENAGMMIPGNLPGELIITVFFHDTGLVRTSGEQHGKESRLLCEEFFSGTTSGMQKPGEESFRAILHAIEHHDDKSLKTDCPVIRPGVVPGLLSLLAAADDLDAFGNMGIYRYAEIYLMRGMEPEQLPHRVAENVKNRFDNLKNTFAFLDEFIRAQEYRFRRVYDFYLRLSQAYAGRNERPSWEPALIEVIRESLMDRKNLLQAGREWPETGFDEEIRAWFRSLDAENVFI